MAAKIIVFLIVCCIGVQVAFSHPSKRQVNTDESKKADDRICGQSTPCGWAVYNKLNRNVNYFMKNQCSCTPDTHCIRVEDDISVNAFVYRCRTGKS